jgi:hypothetical protein
MAKRTPRAGGQAGRDATRVALRITDGPMPAYLAAAIDRIQQVDGVEVALVLVARRRSRAGDRLRTRLERAYERLERTILRGGPPALAAARPTLPATVRQLRDAGPAEAATALAAARVDVLVDLAADDPGDGPPVPPGGRWRLRYAVGEVGPRRSRLDRPDRAHDLSEVVLEVDLGADGMVEACRGVGALHRIGYYRSRDAAYWRSASFPARLLARLVAGDPIAAVTGPARPSGPLPAGSREASFGLPPVVDLIGVVARRLVERLLYSTTWVVLTRRRSADAGPPTDLRGFRQVAAGQGRFFADPFVVADGSATRLYVEDSAVGRHHGRILELTLEDGDHWSDGRTVLADLDHRAYPHVVPTSAGLLMTPDSGREGGIDFFRRSGTDWLPAGRCLDGVPASDPTLLEHDGRFWLFVGVTGYGMDPWDELHLYSAADLAGPWLAHPRNPIVADVRSARPAGRVFRLGATLVRPGQDCSLAYGGRTVLKAITTLTETDYAERPIGTIEPIGLPGISRTHTYTFDGPVEAVDGYRRRFRLAAAAERAGS